MSVAKVVVNGLRIALALLIAFVVVSSMIVFDGCKRMDPKTKEIYCSENVSITNEKILGISEDGFNLNLYLPVIHIG